MNVPNNSWTVGTSKSNNNVRWQPTNMSHSSRKVGRKAGSGSAAEPEDSIHVAPRTHSTNNAKRRRSTQEQPYETVPITVACNFNWKKKRRLLGLGAENTLRSPFLKGREVRDVKDFPKQSDTAGYSSDLPETPSADSKLRSLIGPAAAELAKEKDTRQSTVPHAAQPNHITSEEVTSRQVNTSRRGSLAEPLTNVEESSFATIDEGDILQNNIANSLAVAQSDQSSDIPEFIRCGLDQSVYQKLRLKSTAHGFNEEICRGFDEAFRFLVNKTYSNESRATDLYEEYLKIPEDALHKKLSFFLRHIVVVSDSSGKYHRFSTWRKNGRPRFKGRPDLLLLLYAKNFNHKAGDLANDSSEVASESKRCRVLNSVEKSSEENITQKENEKDTKMNEDIAEPNKSEAVDGRSVKPVVLVIKGNSHISTPHEGETMKLKSPLSPKTSPDSLQVPLLVSNELLSIPGKDVLETWTTDEIRQKASNFAVKHQAYLVENCSAILRTYGLTLHDLLEDRLYEKDLTIGKLAKLMTDEFFNVYTGEKYDYDVAIRGCESFLRFDNLSVASSALNPSIERIKVAVTDASLFLPTPETTEGSLRSTPPPSCDDIRAEAPLYPDPYQTISELEPLKEDSSDSQFVSEKLLGKGYHPTIANVKDEMIVKLKISQEKYRALRDIGFVAESRVKDTAKHILQVEQEEQEIINSLCQIQTECAQFNKQDENDLQSFLVCADGEGFKYLDSLKHMLRRRIDFNHSRDKKAACLGEKLNALRAEKKELFQAQTQNKVERHTLEEAEDSPVGMGALASLIKEPGVGSKMLKGLLGYLNDMEEVIVNRPQEDQPAERPKKKAPRKKKYW